MSDRPLIAVSGPDEGGWPAWRFTSTAIWAFGGRPLRVSPRRGKGATPADGLVLGGGADVTAPEFSRSEKPPARPSGADFWGGFVVRPAVLLARRIFAGKTAWIDRERDRLEAELLNDAFERNLPVLGICRGAQLINVVRGGTLHRDLGSFYVERPNQWTVLPRKRIEVEAGSALAEALGTSECTVNSLHKQAIDVVGSGLRVCARERSGVVQAIEDIEHPFVLGVQWHPEYLPQRSEQRRLFRQFVRAADRVREGCRRPATEALA